MLCTAAYHLFRLFPRHCAHVSLLDWFCDCGPFTLLAPQSHVKTPLMYVRL